MNFGELVTSSVFARALALFVLALALIAAVVIAFVDYLLGRAVPPDIWNVLYFGLGACLAVTGINFGVVLTPAKKEQTSGTSTSTTNP